MKKIYVLSLSALFSLGAFAQSNDLTIAPSIGGQTSAQVVVTPGVADVNQKQIVDIYSYNNNIFINPINFGNIEGYVNVYDLGGKLISSQNLNNSLLQLELPKTGIYIVTVNANGNLFTERVFIK
jgi:hypothetical protein